MRPTPPPRAPKQPRPFRRPEAAERRDEWSARSSPAPAAVGAVGDARDNAREEAACCDEACDDAREDDGAHNGASAEAERAGEPMGIAHDGSSPASPQPQRHEVWTHERMAFFDAALEAVGACDCLRLLEIASGLLRCGARGGGRL